MSWRHSCFLSSILLPINVLNLFNCSKAGSTDTSRSNFVTVNNKSCAANKLSWLASLVSAKKNKYCTLMWPYVLSSASFSVADAIAWKVGGCRMLAGSPLASLRFLQSANTHRYSVRTTTNKLNSYEKCLKTLRRNRTGNAVKATSFVVLEKNQ